MPLRGLDLGGDRFGDFFSARKCSAYALWDASSAQRRVTGSEGRTAVII